MDTYLFYTSLFIHLISLIIGFGSVIVIDTCGILWMNRKISLSFLIRVAHITQRLIWLGWIGLVLSGIPLIVLKGYIDGLTWIKLFFVILIGLNGIYLHIIKQGLEKLVYYDHIPKRMLWRICFSIALSQLGWWGALLIGFVHRHITHFISFLENPFPYIIVSALSIGLIYIIGEVIFSKTSRLHGTE